VLGYCEENLADALVPARLAAQRALTRVYLGGDGQRPDLEYRLLASLRAKGVQVCWTCSVAPRAQPPPHPLFALPFCRLLTRNSPSGRRIPSLSRPSTWRPQAFNESRPKSARVWSSRYARAGTAAADRWQLSDVSDALVDMFVLAEADIFIANPASSFSGCVRDIRAARGRPLYSTQVGIPPHDARAWSTGEPRAETRQR